MWTPDSKPLPTDEMMVAIDSLYSIPNGKFFQRYQTWRFSWAESKTDPGENREADDEIIHDTYIQGGLGNHVVRPGLVSGCDEFHPAPAVLFRGGSGG